MGYNTPFSTLYSPPQAAHPQQVAEPPHQQVAEPWSDITMLDPTNKHPSASNALGINWTAPGTTETVGSTYASVDPQHDGTEQTSRDVSSSFPPEPQRQYQRLAPRPASLPAKRTPEPEDEKKSSSVKRRKRGESTTTLSEQDEYLLELRNEKEPWWSTAARFNARFGVQEAITSLQMRHSRLNHRGRVWLPEEIDALYAAHDYYKNRQWKIICDRVSPVKSDHFLWFS